MDFLIFIIAMGALIYGAEFIIQQSEKLVKCSHCGSSLILQGKLLTSVNENSSKPNSKSKQPIIIIAIILILIFLRS